MDMDIYFSVLTVYQCFAKGAGSARSTLLCLLATFFSSFHARVSEYIYLYSSVIPIADKELFESVVVFDLVLKMYDMFRRPNLFAQSYIPETKEGGERWMSSFGYTGRGAAIGKLSHNINLFLQQWDVGLKISKTLYLDFIENEEVVRVKYVDISHDDVDYLDVIRGFLKEAGVVK